MITAQSLVLTELQNVSLFCVGHYFSIGFVLTFLGELSESRCIGVGAEQFKFFKFAELARNRNFRIFFIKLRNYILRNSD